MTPFPIRPAGHFGASALRFRAFAAAAAVLILILGLLARPATAAAGANTVFLPLKINAPAEREELAATTDKLLAAAIDPQEAVLIDRAEAADRLDYRSGWPPTAEQLEPLAAAHNATYAAAGSLSRLGDRVSLDMVVYDLLGETPPKYFYAEGDADTELAKVTTSLAEEVLAYTGRYFRIASIAVEGNKRIDSGAILRQIKSQAGDRYDADRLNEDLVQVFAMGFFDDVQIDVEESDAGKKITFKVDEKPVIGQVNITGEDKIKEEEIREVISVVPNNIINPKEIRNSTANIRQLYKEKGFYNTEVSVDTVATKDDQVNVTFTISEGKKLYIKEIDIVGNEAFSDKEIKKVLLTSEKGLLSWFTDSGLLKRDMVEQDAARITAFYHNNGYIDAKVGEPEINQTEDGLHVTFNVQEGERYMVGTIDLSGDLIEPKGSLLGRLDIVKERYFSRKTLRDDILHLTDYYASKGFAYAEAKPSLHKNIEDRRVDIVIDIDKGTLVHVNRIIIKGNDRTRDKVIRREITLKETAIFDASALKRSTERLKRLDYFEEVNLSPQQTQSEDLMDILVEVKEKPTGTFSVGAGYSSVDHLMFMGEVSENNFLGKGQRLALQANLGGTSSRYNFSFTEPHWKDSKLLVGFDIYKWMREYDDYERNSQGYGLRFGYPVWEKWKMFWGYSWDDTDLEDVQSTASQIIKDSLHIHTTSALRLALSRDTRNRAFDATKGSEHSISIKYAGGALGGDAAFTKFEASSSWYFPWLWDTTFHLKGAAGYVAENEDDKLPVFERFYLGGLNSVRGFKYGQISPQDPVTKERYGGDKMWFTNFEYIFPLVKDAGLKGLVFFDAGNVYDSGESWDFSDIRKSIGYGFRWMSPMGPLRLEWGYNIDPKPDEAQSNWDFSIGGSF